MTEPTPPQPITPSLIIRSSFGGILMGLANLVPGISGGTMLLAAGIYPKFIDAIAQVTTLKFSKQAIATLATVITAAVFAILLGAGTIKSLVVDHRWIMYALFIGLTLGGVPVLFRMIKPASPSAYLGALLGFFAMAALAYFQHTGATSADPTQTSFLLMFAAGIAGASAMILPGVSGGYLLLVLGVYVPILAGIDQFKTALKATDFQAILEPTTTVILPVGLGVVVGVVLVSNILKLLLAKYEKPTLGSLLGLLLGAVVGLFPFQQGVPPTVGQIFKGQPLTAETLAKITPDKYPTEFFSPTPTQIVAALALIAIGYATTTLISHLGSKPTTAASK